MFHRLAPFALVVIWLANRQGKHPKFFWLLCIPMMNVLIALVMVRYVERPSLFFGRILNARPLVALGALSYSLYLWQELFLVQWRPPVSVLQTFPASVVMALACAAASYRFVEQPFLRLKARALAATPPGDPEPDLVPRPGSVSPVLVTGERYSSGVKPTRNTSCRAVPSDESVPRVFSQFVVKSTHLPSGEMFAIGSYQK